MLLAIDPGNSQSAYVFATNDLRIISADIVSNDVLLDLIKQGAFDHCTAAAVEMVACYGMPVGAEVFDTCVWIGRYVEALAGIGITPEYVYRKDVKLHICGSTRAKDGNIRQALIDRFGEVGTKKAPGWFYGFRSDMWAAYAVAVTYHDGRIAK